MKVTFLLISLLVLQTFQFYEKDSVVVQLTADNFDEEVLNSEYLWIVEFYAPWCGHCKSLAPEFDRAAKALDGIIKLGALDMTQHGTVGQTYGVQGYPTLYFFGDDKQNPEKYEEGRITKDLIRFAINKARKISAERAGITLKERPAGYKAPEEEKEAERAIDESSVVTLDKDNYESTFLQSEGPWILNICASYSDSCKAFRAKWADLGRELSGKVTVAKLDAPDNRDIADIYEAKSYPVVLFFPRGDKYLVKFQEYHGKQEPKEMAEWALQKDEQFSPVNFLQITHQNVFDDHCSEQAVNNFKGVCIILFVPHIYDSSAQERNNYFKILKKVAQKHVSKPFVYLWSEGGIQYEMEQILDAGGSGFPAVAAVTTRAKRVSVMKGALTDANLDAFIQGTLTGKSPFVAFNQTPKIKLIEEWDGLDKQPELSSRDDEDI